MTAVMESLILERDDEHFLYRIMQEHRTAILGVVQRFKTLDPMYDHEDLEQEAFFGVRLATLYWEEARAINMKFKTYLNWHISRHFQGKFKGEDKIVDILDQNNRLLVTIPYSKYKKKGRAIAEDKGYSTRVRSLLVYYDDQPSEHDSGATATDALGAPLHVDGDHIVDVYNHHNDLIITLPLRAYTRMSGVITSHGYRAHTYSIYDPPVHRPKKESHSAANTTRPARPARSATRTARAQTTAPNVVDVYTRRRLIWMRLTPAQYETARKHLEFLGGLAKFHSLRDYPEQPPYEELVERDDALQLSRTLEHIA